MRPLHRLAIFAACLLLVSCWGYSYTLKMETIRSSEASVEFYQTTRHYNSEDRTLYSHRCENVKSNET
jgi:hypothetical protein